MDELATTENRIAFARQHYNDSVMHYNTVREQVPANLVAALGGFAAAALLEFREAERAVPHI
jgi:LemA protein